MTLKEMLQQSADGWATLGRAALLELFVLRHGKPFTGRRRIGRKRAAKQCFQNSTHFVVQKRRGTYVEGFAINRDFPLMPIHHAWVTMDGDDAMDLTLDASKYDYFGIAFDNDTLWAELRRQKRYGILDTGFGMNHELMFRMDPELETICKQIKDNYKWRKDHEQERQGATGQAGS